MMASTDYQALDGYDVIIVGAGISGCSAAWYLKQHGRSALILEANDRSGGKTYTVPDGCGKAGHVDLGASWVNDTTQSYINALIEEFGLERVIQNREGLFLTQQPDGTFFTHTYHDKVLSNDEDLRVFFTKLDEIVKSIDTDDVAESPNATELDSLTILEWVQKNFPERSTLPSRADTIVRTLIGADITQASILYFAHYMAGGGGIIPMLSEGKGDAQYQRLVKGCQSISDEIIARLPKDTLLLNHAVNSISQEGGIVTVTTKNGKSFCAKKAIITIPPPLWTTIHWSPSLPDPKVAISDNLALSTYSKIAFAFTYGWWQPRLSGGVMFAQGPIQFIRDTSVPSKECWVLTCFAVGPKGNAWGSQSKEMRRRSAWNALRSAFIGLVDEVPDPVSVREMLWDKHEYFWGAPSSFWPTGMLSKGFQKHLKAPYQNVHFAGSETASVFKGFMEGGVRASHRAVEEIIR